MKRLHKWLLYITNNEEISRHEEIFDAAFFVINTVALVAGIFMFIHYHEAQWISVLVIEYTWAFGNMRNNRP